MVAGFEARDLILGTTALVRMITEGRASSKTRTGGWWQQGNAKARQIMYGYSRRDAHWRGIGDTRKRAGASGGIRGVRRGGSLSRYTAAGAGACGMPLRGTAARAHTADGLRSFWKGVHAGTRRGALYGVVGRAVLGLLQIRGTVMADRILAGHGSGGKLMNEMIGGLIRRVLGRRIQLDDSAVLSIGTERIAFTTEHSRSRL